MPPGVARLCPSDSCTGQAKACGEIKLGLHPFGYSAREKKIAAFLVSSDRRKSFITRPSRLYIIVATGPNALAISWLLSCHHNLGGGFLFSPGVHYCSKMVQPQICMTVFTVVITDVHTHTHTTLLLRLIDKNFVTDGKPTTRISGHETNDSWCQHANKSIQNKSSSAVRKGSIFYL